jgi:hypothetical protein
MNMRIPEFTAALSLGKTRGHYRTRGFQVLSGGSSTLSHATPEGVVPAQSHWGCYCTEPDIRRVCTSPGHCYNKIVCLQWSCPGGGSDLDGDDGDDGDDDGE